MTLDFSTRFNIDYLKALKITKKEQPNVWKTFCFDVPSFDCFFLKRFISSKALFLQKKYLKIIRSSAAKYQDWWMELNSKILIFLKKMFFIDINVRIRAYVCVTPLYTRNIIKKRFLIPTNLPKKRFAEIVLHELSHFFFFNSLKSYKIKPNYKMWCISEMIVPFLLNKYFNEDAFDSYIKANIKQQQIIRNWIEGQMSFKQMINSLYMEVDNGKI